MAEYDKDKQAKDYYTDIPVNTHGYYLKGAHSLDWGMKNRLARIFRPDTGKTVMFAIDHGYFQGPTTGLERPDVNIVPLMPHADAIMLTRGILRTTVPPTLNKAVVMRCSGGPSILKELSDEELADRRKLWRVPEPRFKTGWLARYARMATSANTGAILK